MIEASGLSWPLLLPAVRLGHLSDASYSITPKCQAFQLWLEVVQAISLAIPLSSKPAENMEDSLLVITFIEPRPLLSSTWARNWCNENIVRCTVELCPWTSIFKYHLGFAHLICTPDSNQNVSSVQFTCCSPWHELRQDRVLRHNEALKSN